MASKRDIVRELLDRHGETHAEELGIDVAKQTPSALFELLCGAVLYSARIGSQIATEAARNLQSRGWRTAQAMAESAWEQRVEALNEAGYTRYQERTATLAELTSGGQQFGRLVAALVRTALEKHQDEVLAAAKS